MHCWRWNIQISSYLSLRNIVFKHFNNFLTYLLANWRSSAIFAPKGLDLSWMLLLYQIIITITCWHQLFQNTSLFNQFTSLLALNCSCPNFFWNVLQVWMTGKDVYLQITWNWPDKTWNILCSYCLQWNTSQSKFRNHYFLFLFAFSILSQLFLIWGCTSYLHVVIMRGFTSLQNSAPDKNSPFWALSEHLTLSITQIHTGAFAKYVSQISDGAPWFPGALSGRLPPISC